METNFTKGNWRFSREYNCITVSRIGIIEGSKTICDLNNAVSFDYKGGEAVGNGYLIASTPNLLNTVLRNYVFHQRKANENNSYAIETDAIRAELAGSIAKALNVDVQIIQEWVEHLAHIKDIKIEDLKFE